VWVFEELVRFTFVAESIRYAMYEENNPPDISISEAKFALERFFPEKEVEIEFHYHGTYNVFIVNGEYIFRFASSNIPKRESRELLLNEIKTLNVLRNHLFVQIPNPEFIDLDSDIPIIGYRKIPGISLNTCYNDTSTRERESLAVQIASFLEVLHSDKIREIMKNHSKFTPELYHKEWSQFYSRLQDFVYPLLWSDAIYWTESLFTDFLENSENFEFKPCVIHGDFDTSNILVNPSTLKVTGIIDFEETRLYDPAVDLLFLGEGIEFLKSLLKSYPRTLDSSIRERMLFQFGRQPLIYIESGLVYEIKSMVDYGLNELIQRIADWDGYKSMLDVAFSRIEY